MVLLLLSVLVPGMMAASRSVRKIVVGLWKKKRAKAREKNPKIRPAIQF